jgi:hypothetical protein
MSAVANLSKPKQLAMPPTQFDHKAAASEKTEHRSAVA